MTCYKLLKKDLKYYSKQWLMYNLLLICFVLYICIEFTFIKDIAIEDSYLYKGTMGDVWLYLFGGNIVYKTSLSEALQLPIRWFLFYIITLLSVSAYPYNELHLMGPTTISKCKNKRIWWLSKCFWNVIVQFENCFVAYFTIFVFCLTTKRTISFKTTDEIVISVMKINDKYVGFTDKMWIELVIMPFILVLFLSIVQLFASLMLKPVFAFLIVSIYLVVSMGITTPCIFGCYGMAMRSECILEGGLSVNNGIISIVVCTFVIVALGQRTMDKYDIY